jgi:preprotein translocase subunit SecB
MGIMKDTKVKQYIKDVKMLTEKINGICKNLKDENVDLKFAINHTMSDENAIEVSVAIQRIDYLKG